ncbi:YcxB family protein [Streptomyces sp. NPDC018019]|uniref:YcxB family protein n=1 Tax=Streptomyces sp. NPDC018019 TaxID=3365030 RepID=UPI00378944DA
MSGEPQTGTQIELFYRATVEDFRQGLQARARTTPAGRRFRWVLCAAAVLLYVAAALLWMDGGSVDMRLLVAPTLILLVLLGMPWLQARQFRRYAETIGECRTVVDENGITVTTRQQTSALTWQAVPRYTESPHVFVLFSGDKDATSLTIVPKRGASSPADVDRLRAVFDRHLTRL